MIRVLRDCLNPTVIDHRKSSLSVNPHFWQRYKVVKAPLVAYEMLGVVNADPPVLPGIVHLIGLALSNFVHVIQEHIVRPR